MSNDITVFQSKPGATATIGGFEFEIAAQVTRRVLQQQDNIPLYVTFEGRAYTSDVQQPGRGGSSKMAPARVAEVVNLETGEFMLLIMNRVLESELETYTGGAFEIGKDGEPDAEKLKGAYIGRSFAIRRVPGGTDADGKDRRYKIYTILEIRPKTTAAGVAVEKAEGATVIDGTTTEAVDRAKRKR